MTSRITRLLVLLLALGVGYGCSTVEPGVGSPGVGSAGLTGSVGVLHVERTDGEADRAVLRAAFARYYGIEGDAVLRLLGSGSAAELGQCLVVDPAGELGSADADVELLDVGVLHVSVADTEAELTASTFPDLASVLAGVFYASDAALSVPEPEVDEYRFAAEGSPDVGSFEVVVPSPTEPRGVALVGADGTGGLLDGQVPEVDTRGDLTLLWDGEDPRDSIEIELIAAGQTLACTASDEGSFRLTAEDLAVVSADPEARLVVRRVRLAPFDAAGMDVAYARIAAARTFPLSIR